MAYAALLIGTIAGIAAFALSLALGQPVWIALLIWCTLGTFTTVLALAAITLTPEDNDLPEGLSAA